MWLLRAFVGTDSVDGHHHEAEQRQGVADVDGGVAEEGALVDDQTLQRRHQRTADDGHH